MATPDERTVGFARREWWLVAAMMLPNGLSLISSGMLAVSLPSIQNEYGVPVQILAWVVAAGQVPRVPLEPIYGRLADMFGKRQFYLLGFTVFTLGSLLMGIAPSFAWLAIASAFQGFGTASFSISMAMITEVFPQERRGRALGMQTASGPLGITAGPILGGMVIEWGGWRANFFLIALACLVALTIILWVVPAGPVTRDASPFDWFGALALITSFGGTILAATTSGLIPFGSPANLAIWLVAGLGFLLLAWNARIQAHPLVGPDLVRNRRFTGPALAVGLRMFAFDGLRFVLVLYLANVLRGSPATVGWLMALYGMPLFVGILFGGYLADRWVTRFAGNVGMIGLTAGLLWTSAVSTQANALTLAPGTIAASFFAGACLVPFSKEAVAALGSKRTSLAAGLFDMVRFTGSATATPLLGLILARGLEMQGGLQQAPEPYQMAFQALALVAGIGAMAVMLIPASKRELPQVAITRE